MSAYQRTKGHNWEREVARDLTEMTGIAHRRVLTETRDGNSGDVTATGAFPFVYQCKCGAKPDIYGAVEEVAKVAGVFYGVAAIHRTGRGGEKLAVLTWDDWLEIAAVVAREYKP